MIRGLSCVHSIKKQLPPSIAHTSITTKKTPLSLLFSRVLHSTALRSNNNQNNGVLNGATAPPTLNGNGNGAIIGSNNNNNVQQQQQLAPGSAMSASGASARSVIIRLLENIGSKKEVDQYLRYYSSIDTPRFAVIKVGGGCLMGAELETLANSLSFLADVGLIPVVLHGAGPQLNDELREQGIESDYIGGMRITTPQILRVAKQVFLRENAKLVRALEERGTRARPIVSGVFEAEYLNKEKMQYVGQVTRVNIEQVHQALSLGHVPILTCMGETVDGQVLNINADVAGQELAKALKPVKVVYISAKGGVFDKDNKLIPVIDLDLDYPILMNESWFKHGDRLKLKEIKTLLDELPLSSSVAITDSQNLPKELFTHKGSGTLVRRSEKIHIYDSFDNIDMERLKELIEHSFQGQLVDGYLQSLKPYLYRLYLSENYRAVAIITKDPSQSDSVPYLDKFAVAKLSQGEGTAQQLWNHLKRDHPQLYWRSRSSNFINSWYFERAQGSFSQDPWTVFWYGLESLKAAEKYISKALERPMTIDRSKPPQVRDINNSTADISKNQILIDPVPIKAGASVRNYSTLTGRSPPAGAARRSFHSSTNFSVGAPSSPSSSSVTRIGLIGARGHTGSELVKIMSRHPFLSLSVASSRQLKGRAVADVFASSLPTSSSKFSEVVFTDLQPSQLPQREDVDVWILALPNDLAAPYVAALEASQSKAKVVDLSADFRFTPSWTYGLPERRGARSSIRGATRIANPGCYATGTQLSLFPLSAYIDRSYSPHVFGVSGYSGAGTTPSRKNDVNALKDNLMPYALQNHTHEKEVSYQLKGDLPQGIRFMPHVAPWFRGISLTIALQLNKPMDANNLLDLYRAYYKDEPLVTIESGIPEVSANADKHHVAIGGVSVDKATNRAVVCATLDNLLKGAASQCIQNINIMQGYRETEGLL